MAVSKTTVITDAGKAFLKYLETAIAIADSAGANVVTSYTGEIGQYFDLSNKKGVVYVEVTDDSATGDGALDCAIQGSHDGVTYVDIAAVTMDIDNSGKNKQAATFDCSDYYLPYWRVKLFTDGTDTGAAGAVSVAVIVGV